MKKLFFFPVLAFLAVAFTTGISNYSIDTTTSKVVWTASKVTGTHTGTVKVKSGALKLEEGKLVGGEFVIDMTSIDCTDLQGEWKDKLVGHLKSADFFGVDKYPTAKFVITRAIPVDTKGNYRIIGNISIKETMKEIKFNAAVSETAGRASATAKITLDRTDFDVRYGSGSFFDNLGDKTIYDEFDLEVTLASK
jgi:polyisoprenoid-binding protein YceI